ncbi:MAG: hypothetical protein JRH08_00655 [Deltaproteobacteria bacterium]|nr:hypothetical protein [Deltaproteobacteria bacterium]MBW2124213.1 hypothetical protein [Deltaproteobacteria bacterium]
MQEKRKLGRFLVDRILIENRTDEVAAVFAELKFVPVDILYHFDLDKYEYIGISEFFEPVPKGFKAPLYDILVIGTNKRGKIILEIKKLATDTCLPAGRAEG